MNIDTEKLRTVRTYAQMKGWTVQHIYRLISEKKLDSVIIDGVKFIRINDK